MNVQETVFQMMQAFPTLYRTRALALLTLFDSPHAGWENGELLNYDTSHLGRGRLDFLPYVDNEIADTDQPGLVSDVIFHRRENAKAQFVYDNAHLLSREPLSGFPEHSVIRFEGRRFADIPENVASDWFEAAKELAQCVIIHKYEPPQFLTADARARNEAQLKDSVKICTQFLERFRVISPCPYARAARIAELTREAQALGLQLLDSEGNSLKETV